MDLFQSIAGYLVRFVDRAYAHAQRRHPRLNYRLAWESYQREEHDDALVWWSNSAEQGYRPSLYALGWLYHKGGKGFPCDHEKALEWYRKGADLGDPKCPNEIGTIFEEGSGVVQDYEEAVRWYRRAAELGNPPGEYNLGRAYLYGLGVETDVAEGTRWVETAARKNDFKAQCLLADLYREGQGLERDLIQAYAWLVLANGGEDSEDARDDLARVAREMNAEEISAAEKLAEKLRARIRIAD